MTVYLYELRCDATGQRYIGQTNNPEKRESEHRKNSSNSTVRKLVKQHGADSFSFEVFDETESTVEANFMEINAIENGADATLLNRMAGGALYEARDRAMCSLCDCPFGLTFRFCEDTGIMLFRINADRAIEEMLFSCADCRQRDCYTEASRNRTLYPLSRELTQNALLDLAFHYRIPDAYLRALAMVDGKLNPRFLYGYFTRGAQQ